MVDEWSGFAALLANLIEKYALVLNLDALPDLVIEEAVPEKDGADEMIHPIIHSFPLSIAEPASALYSLNLENHIKIIVANNPKTICIIELIV